MTSLDDLKAAFAGESQANRKYLAFAEKAEKEGFPQVGKVFRAAAAAETVHAHNHLRAMEGIKDTVSNVKSAIDGEHHEFSEMYPEFLENAKKEGHKNAERTFWWANEVEKIHHKIYSEALKAVESGKDMPAQDVFVCSVCGMTVEGKAPDTCPVCGATHDKFEKI
jgi:rubrerythrin